MKPILKLAFVIVVLSTVSLYANINECKNDLYYANGIMMNDTEDIARTKWQIQVKEMLRGKPDISSKIANILVAYNRSQGFDDDIYEAFEQMMGNEWGWTDFSNYFKLYLQTRLIQQLGNQHSLDLTTQVNNYKQSIKDGHGVIVIAHSQGNYFTNEAYEELDEWMKKYFHMFGVATPANHVAGFPAGDNTAPYVKFHNDIIKLVVTGLPSNLEDPNEEHNQNVSYAAHNFYDSYLTAENSKTKILNFILSKIEEHSSAPSQWQTDQEYDIDTMNYRITVKHRFDTSITMNDEVYPFAPSKKLYQSKDENGVFQYVKASCGGTEIKASWEGQAEGEFYLLEGTGEKISSLHNFMEDFEESAFGWTNNQRDSSAGLTKFLGRFGGSNGIQEISKTYSFGETYKNRGIIIKFDMYQIDSWDGDSYFNQTYENGIEKFIVFLNDQLVAQDIYQFGYAYSNSIQTAWNEFFGWGPEIIHHYEINAVTDEYGDIKLGFGTTLNQPVDDESYGIDNIEIRLSDET